jgi:hypothetical protein
MKDPETDILAGSDIGIAPAAAPALFDQIRIGFTMGTGGQNSGIQVTNYKSGIFHVISDALIN